LTGLCWSVWGFGVLSVCGLLSDPDSSSRASAVFQINWCCLCALTHWAFVLCSVVCFVRCRLPVLWRGSCRASSSLFSSGQERLRDAPRCGHGPPEGVCVLARLGRVRGLLAVGTALLLCCALPACRWHMHAAINSSHLIPRHPAFTPAGAAACLPASERRAVPQHVHGSAGPGRHRVLLGIEPGVLWFGLHASAYLHPKTFYPVRAVM
jgi:hypothetical protein